jgi:DNA-binding HxlR family transcriptional regulator
MSPDKTENGPSDHCPIAATMDLLNGKWTLHILRELMDGRKRFNELSRALGVSSRTLCCRLRALEEQGILVREIKNTIPPWVEYELTEKGRALNHVLDSIAEWGLRYMAEAVEECREAHSAPYPPPARVLPPPPQVGSSRVTDGK